MQDKKKERERRGREGSVGGGEIAGRKKRNEKKICLLIN